MQLLLSVFFKLSPVQPVIRCAAYAGCCVDTAQRQVKGISLTAFVSLK